jgi:hypothetical protein
MNGKLLMIAKLKFRAPEETWEEKRKIQQNWFIFIFGFKLVQTIKTQSLLILVSISHHSKQIHLNMSKMNANQQVWHMYIEFQIIDRSSLYLIMSKN